MVAVRDGSKQVPHARLPGNGGLPGLCVLCAVGTNGKGLLTEAQLEKCTQSCHSYINNMIQSLITYFSFKKSGYSLEGFVLLIPHLV